MNVRLTRQEAAILTDVLTLVMNDPDWQDMATATDQEWTALQHAHAKIYAAMR